MCYDEKCRGELIFLLSLSLPLSFTHSFLFSSLLSLFLSRREDRMKIDSTLIVTFHSLDDDNGETSVPINLFPRELYWPVPTYGRRALCAEDVCLGNEARIIVLEPRGGEPAVSLEHLELRSLTPRHLLMILLGSGLCNSRTARKSVAVYNKPPRNNVIPYTNYDVLLLPSNQRADYL